MPLRSYYHRHSRSIFWELQVRRCKWNFKSLSIINIFRSHQDIVPFGNNVVFRYLFGWLMPIKVSFLKLTQTETVKQLYEKTQIIQDLLVPISKMAETIREFDKLLNVYPMWLCPFRLWNDPGLVHPADGKEVEMYVDIGVYGTVKVKRGQYQAERTTRQIEDFVTKANGFQMLYDGSFRTYDEFRQMFDHSLYDQMRQKYKCTEAFPEVYGKITRAARE